MFHIQSQLCSLFEVLNEKDWNIFTYQSFFVLQKNPVKYIKKMGPWLAEIDYKICGNS